MRRRSPSSARRKNRREGELETEVMLQLSPCQAAGVSRPENSCLADVALRTAWFALTAGGGSGERMASIQPECLYLLRLARVKGCFWKDGPPPPFCFARALRCNSCDFANLGFQISWQIWRSHVLKRVRPL